jgi:HlyD family secretion protein
MATPLHSIREKLTAPRVQSPVNSARMSATLTQPVPLLPPGLGMLLELETKIRATASLRELQYLVANEAGALASNSRVIILVSGRLGKQKIVAASHARKIEADAPLAAAFEKLVNARIHEQTKARSAEILVGYIGPFELIERDGAPPKHAIIFPLVRKKTQIGTLLFISDFIWRDSATKLLQRLADTTSHAWEFHRPSRRFHLAGRYRRLAALLILCVLGLISLIPVPMTALAPMRVVTIEPTVIAAPIDGVIDELLVSPNQDVKAGAPLLRYVELSSVARVETAERELAVADAKFKRISMVALSNLDAKRELAIVEAEFNLKRAERDFAVDQLKRSRVVSPTSGVALFGDKKDWVGRPVVAGERILELGNASRVELQLELPIEDAIAMSVGQPVSAFLDTAPLSPLSAEVTRINHEARAIEGRGLAFIIHAKITDGQIPPLGVRGTAHIRGELVALGLFLFRRPISSFRQWAGI